ncbi:hypothetical protein ACLB2K_053267 [Fragaria x ananassa]
MSALQCIWTHDEKQNIRDNTNSEGLFELAHIGTCIFDQILIPVHDETLDHWFLVLIKVRDEVVEIWDSKADMASSRRRHEIATSVILLVQKVFASDMKKPGDIYYNFSSFEVTVLKGNQWDVNGFESGIYLMRHMQLYGERWFDGQVMLPTC